MSIEEGLVSTDVDKIKAARKTAKGQVTRKVSNLETDLLIDDGKFLLDEIDEENVQELYQKLGKSFAKFEELHERFLQYKESEADADAEKATLEEEGNYYKDVKTNFDKAKRSYVKYKKALAVKVEEDKKKVEDCTRAEKIAALVNEIEVAKNDLECKKEAANAVIKSSDEHVRATAGVMREELIELFSSYKSKVVEHKTVTMFPKNSASEEKYTQALDYTADMKEVEELKTQLSAVISKAKALGESIFKETSTNPINAKTNSNLVKLQKLSCPNFSGSPRDYGHFKRDFLELVKVPGRSDIEIGKNLKNSIPDKFLHLINHLPTSDHVGMMEVLDDRFGSGNLVIQEIVQQLRKMKPVITDKGVVEFVEKVEQMKLDLEGLNLLEELANHTNISELESKLPHNISVKWVEKVVNDKLNEKSSKDKFSVFMKYLNDAKKMVDYHISQNASGGCEKSTTQVSFVMGTTLTAKVVAGTGDGKKRGAERPWSWYPCLACNVDGATNQDSTCHPMNTCSVWNSLTMEEKNGKVKCLKHPFKDDHTTQECTVSGRTCKLCKQDDHHFLLCSKMSAKSNTNVSKVSASSFSALS